MSWVKRVSAGIIAGFLVFPQMASAQGAAPVQNAVVRATLSNGMQVVLLPNKLAPVVTTVITYGAGSNDDTMPGIAHATEHMMFRGTKDISAGQFAIIAARAGAEYNASTQETSTDYYFKLPSAYTGIALRLEADRMTAALDRESDWKTERGAIEQEVRAHESVPGASVVAKMRRAFFGNTPYADDGVGTVPSFEKMHASDIAQFYHAWYHPNNATLVVAGDIDAAQTLAEIHRDFDGIPSATLPAHKKYPLAFTATTLHDTIAELPVPIAATSFRFPSLDSPDYAAGQVLEAVFDSGRGAFAALQTKGEILAGLAVAGASRDVGMMMLGGIGLPGSAPQNVQTSIDGVIAQYRTSGVPQPLIDAAKQRLLSQQDYREASISGLAFTWAGSLAENGASPDAIYDQIQHVTPDDVNRVLRTYMDPKRSVSMLLEPKSMSAIPHTDPNAGVENVKYTPDKEEPLPAWTVPYFKAGLKVPDSIGGVATYHLRNGLTLTVRSEHSSPTIVVRGSIRTSPELYEPRGKDGVASIAEALLQWGTSTYDRMQYQAQLENIAASADLGTSFSTEVQSKNFDRAMQLLADGMLHPAFPAQAFDLVKNNTTKTLAAVEHQPRTQAAIARTNALYPPGDPRRRRATAATVSAVTLADVKRWYAFAYRPDLTTMAIVGDVKPEEARAAVERYFGAWHATGKRPSFKYPQVKKSGKESVTVSSPTSTHSEVTLTQVINVHRGDPDAIPLALANTMLSEEGTGSMLFRDLRETKGYVYEVNSSVDIGRSSSTFSIDFASDPKNVNRAQAAALADIRRLQTDLVPMVELQRAKALLLAEQILPLDSYSGIASDILDTAKYGRTAVDDAYFWHSLIQTTPEQVRDAMRRHVRPDAFTRVIVAPGT
jgi:zinc protease